MIQREESNKWKAHGVATVKSITKCSDVGEGVAGVELELVSLGGFIGDLQCPGDVPEDRASEEGRCISTPIFCHDYDNCRCCVAYRQKRAA